MSASTGTIDSTVSRGEEPGRIAKPRRTARWLFRRAVLGLLTLLGVSILIFVATQALPGDVALVILGTDHTQEQLVALRRELGLDRPLIAQYWGWLSGVVTGNMGNSLVNGEPVSALLGGRILNSFTLGALTMIVVLPVSLIAGIWAANSRDRVFDKMFMGVSMTLNALPEFVTGTALIALLGTNLFHLLPPVSIIPAGDMPWWHLDALVLPVITLALFGVTYLSRLIRASFIDVMDSEYIQGAQLKGLSTSRILFRHALPNAIAPSIPAASIVAAFTLAGVVVIEYLFAYPGLGLGLIDAVGNHDLPVIQAIVLLMATIFYLFNLLADVLSTLMHTGGQR